MAERAMFDAKLFTLITSTRPVYDEEIYRQRLLICLFLHMDLKLATYTAHLILQGSISWTAQMQLGHEALWWNLPKGIEGQARHSSASLASLTSVAEELLFRRSAVLETLASLQNHIVSVYCSRNRQCRLGCVLIGLCHFFHHELASDGG